jgi:hypothetical protein
LLQVFERARLRELERPNRELEMELLFRKNSSVLREGASVREGYEFIDAEYAIVPADQVGGAPTIVQMCRWLEYRNPGITTGGHGRKAPRRGGGTC